MTEEEKAALKGRCAEAFTKVSGRVVKSDEFLHAIKTTAYADLGRIGGFITTHEASKAAHTKEVVDGMYEDAEKSRYLDSRVLQETLNRAVDGGMIPAGQGAYVDKVVDVIVKSFESSPDHTEEVKAGTIKPVTPKPK